MRLRKGSERKWFKQETGKEEPTYIYQESLKKENKTKEQNKYLKV